MMLFVGSFTAFLIIGVPVVMVLGLASVTYLVMAGQAHLLIAVPQRLIVGVDQFILLTVPLFILAGNLMTVGGISGRIIDFSQAAFGHLRGGLSQVNISSSVFFSGISGSATADAAAMGSILIPGMKREGYPVPYAAALTAVSSLIGPMIPPSIQLIVFGALTGTSISSLFLAGIIPGLLLALGLSLYAYWAACRHNHPSSGWIGWAGLGRAFLRVLPVLVLPVLILGGIRFGIVTATEAAVIAVLYALAASTLLYRSLTWRSFYDAVVNSAIMTAGIMLIVAMASIVSFIFGIERIPETIVRAMLELSDNKYVVLLIINVVLLLLGCFLEPIGAMIITLPVLIELASQFDINPVHLGVIVCMNLVIGLATPPVGLCLFIVCAIGKVSIEEVSKAIVPMVLVVLAVLMLVTYVPFFSLYLPGLTN